MAGDEVGLVDVVGAADGLVAEAQVADGDAAGLLRVVLEVGLDVFVGVVADDLRGVLVGADRAVAADAPELALDRAGRAGDGGGLDFGEAEVRHVVDDADGEAGFGGVLGELRVDREDAAGRRVLAAESVAAGGEDDVAAAGLAEGGGHVEVERLAEGAGLLRAVEDGHLLGGRGERGEERGADPRTVEANLDQADLLALGRQVVDDLFGHVADAAHRHDDAVGVGSAVVVEELVVGAELGVDLGHAALDDGGKRVIGAVAGLAVLEEHVAVLVRAAHRGMLGVQRVVAERLDRFHVAHVLEVGVVPGLDLLDFVARAEPVEEVQERHPALDGREVGHRREVHDLLRIALGQHRETGLAAGVDVAVVAEDVQRLRGHRAGRHVEHARQAFAGDLVHVGDHEEQALRRREGRRQRAGGERAVHRAGGAGFGLHLDHLRLRPENVLEAVGRPLVHEVRHRRRRRDGVDSRHFRVRICDVGRRLVPVHRLFFACHVYCSLVIGGVGWSAPASNKFFLSLLFLPPCRNTIPPNARNCGKGQ